MAETVAQCLVERAGLAGQVTVESFGTSGYHAGDGADPRALAALARHGWPARAHRARRLTADALAQTDLVLCADRENLAEVARLAGSRRDAPAGAVPAGAVRAGAVPAGAVPAGAVPAGAVPADRIRLLRTYDPSAVPGDDEVPDPWYGGDAEFDLALEMIERSCRGLVDELVAARR